MDSVRKNTAFRQGFPNKYHTFFPEKVLYFKSDLIRCKSEYPEGKPKKLCRICRTTDVGEPGCLGGNPQQRLRRL